MTFERIRLHHTFLSYLNVLGFDLSEAAQDAARKRLVREGVAAAPNNGTLHVWIAPDACRDHLARTVAQGQAVLAAEAGQTPDPGEIAMVTVRFLDRLLAAGRL